MSKNNTLTDNINSEGIEKLIKNQGILLEHQTYCKLQEHFETINPGGIDSGIHHIEEKYISHKLYSEYKKEEGFSPTNIYPIEIDVLFQTNYLIAENLDFYECSDIDNLDISDSVRRRVGPTIETYFIIQCKGQGCGVFSVVVAGGWLLFYP